MNATTVKGRNLKAGMILLDSETGEPVFELDHKMQAIRNSGCAHWAGYDMVLRTYRDTNIHLNSTVRVAR